MFFKRLCTAAALPLTLFSFTAAAQLPVKVPSTASKHAYEASPEIYKLIKENDKFRVMLATWKPGQSDDWHTHHGELVNFNVSDCKLKGELPDGKVGTLERKNGEAGFNVKDDVHRVTNVGDSDCVLLIVERK